MWWYILWLGHRRRSYSHVALCLSHAFMGTLPCSSKPSGIAPRSSHRGWTLWTALRGFPRSAFWCDFKPCAPPFYDAGCSAQWHSRRVWADKLKALFRTPSKRTVQRRMHTLQAEAQDSPPQAVVTRLLAKLPQLLPAVGSTWRPTTSNAAERFLGAFDRFYRCKGPFQNVASAHKHVALFMLGSVFETFSAEAAAERQGRCPLQLALRGGSIPSLSSAQSPNPPTAPAMRRSMTGAV